MRKIILTLFILSILVLGGCAAPEEEGTAAQQTTQQAKGPVVREVRTGQEELPARGPELSAELKSLIAKADSVESMEYFYKEAEKGARYYVRDNNIRIEFTSRKFEGDLVYDNVYIDLAKRTATGYCEDHDPCKDVNLLDVPQELDIKDFNLETPFDVLDSITYGEEKGSETISGKTAVIIEIPLSDGNTKRIWVWDYKGIPIRYTIVGKEGEVIRRIDYEGMVVNNVKASDVIR